MMRPQEQWQRQRRAMIQRLESLQRAGVRHLPKPHATGWAGQAEIGQAVAASPQVPAAAPPTPPTSAQPARPSRSLLEAELSGAHLTLEQRRSALATLSQQVAHCTRCSELACTRTQTVFGVGNPQARLCFLGEAPGADEDRQGEPFVGRAGQLLNKILAACGLNRQDVYILNVLKCRPPGNRTPLPDEAANCRAYLDEQLDIIRPQFLCCLGAVAAQNLLDSKTAIGRMRGRWHDYRNIRVLVTYHPAYLLRNPAAKKDTWEDMQELMRAMQDAPTVPGGGELEGHGTS